LYQPNAGIILGMLRAQDVVLDVGGWARPFNRANYVMDQEPYATRGFYGLPPQGGERECFTSDTWIQRDICAREPFPFAAKEIDFVICSHTLEDVRDPLWVCAEMIRVAKAGYLEVPSRVAESSRGIEPGQVGWSHHRWLIDIADGKVRFLMKYHKIHSEWRLSFPKSFFQRLAEDRKVQWLFWRDSFVSCEAVIHGPDTIRAELGRYVQEVRPYPRWLLAADQAARIGVALGRRVLAKARISR
jgi:Methyltransferase domain